jgi:hypothetical protein
VYRTKKPVRKNACFTPSPHHQPAEKEKKIQVVEI